MKKKQKKIIVKFEKTICFELHNNVICAILPPIEKV